MLTAHCTCMEAKNKVTITKQVFIFLWLQIPRIFSHVGFCSLTQFCCDIVAKKIVAKYFHVNYSCHILFVIVLFKYISPFSDTVSHDIIVRFIIVMYYSYTYCIF